MMSFSSRLTLGYAAVVAMSLGLFLLVARLLVWQQAILSTDLLNDAEFAEVKGRLLEANASTDPVALAKRLREHAELDASLFFFEVRDSSGAVVFRSPNLAREELPHQVHGMPRATVRVGELGLVRVGEYEAGAFDVHIASPLEAVERLTERFTRVGIVLVVILVFLSLGVGWILARAATAPVRALQHKASTFGPDNLDVRISPEPAGDDELARLARLLNGLFERLSASFAQVRRFSAEAGHELRTPLSLIRLHAERIAALPGVPAEARELAEGQMEEVGRLNRIVDDLLLISRLDSGSIALELRTRDARALLAEFGEDAAVLAEETGVRWSCDPGPDAKVRIDPLRLRQVLFNLLSNALRVTPAGAAVSVRASATSSRWVVELVDEGPGLDASRLATLFEPFSTKPVPGERAHQGTGLGLALSRSLIHAMGGSLIGQPGPEGRGMCFRLEIPLDASRSPDPA